MTKPPGADHVFERVQTCLHGVVGGSGHPTRRASPTPSLAAAPPRPPDGGIETVLDGRD
jgi:hypothetical protein